MNLDFQSKFKDVIMKMEKAGNEYAEAKGQAWQAMELKSSILASLISAQGDLPTSKAEIVAKNSEDYKQHIRETALAITKELRLKAEYEKWKSSFEALRSLSSLEKATQNLIEH